MKQTNQHRQYNNYRMKKLIILALVCSMSVTVLQGCSRNDDKDGNLQDVNQEVSDTSSKTDGESENVDSENNGSDEMKTLFDNLIAIVGEKDKAVVDLFGKGTEEKNESGELLNRTYENVKLFDETVVLSVGYDEGKCFIISLYVEGTNYQKYKDALSNVLGTGDINEGDLVEEGSGAKQTIWKSGSKHISLIEAYGSISITVS